MSFFRVTLTARKPFSSFTVPGTNPSVVVNRQGALLDEETTATLKKALTKGAIPNVQPEDVAIVEQDTPGGGANSKEDSSELAKEVEALTAERDTAIDERDSARQEAAGLAKQVEALEAAAAESDATKLASGILDSLTVPQLTELAKTRKVEHDAKATKAEIIAALVQPVPAE